MPNWCSNNLYIKGDPTELAEFVARVTLSDEGKENRGQRIDILGSLYPTPQELKDTSAGSYTAEPHPNWANLLKNGEITQEWHDELVRKNAEGYARAQANRKKYGYADWYDWNNAKWGTKWGDCETFLSGDPKDGSIEFIFNSAWAPPIEGIAHITTLFPNLSFALSYIEEGMDFYGLTTFDEDGDYFDNCLSVTDIEGVKEIDWDSDDYEDTIEQNEDAILRARDRLLEEAGIFSEKV